MASFEDDDDFSRAASAFPALDDDLDGFGMTTTAAPAPIQNISSEPLDFDFDPMPASSAPPVRVTGDDEMQQFESQFPDIGEPAYSQPAKSAVGVNRSFQGTPIPQQQASYAPPSITPAFEEEPDVIKQWREQQAAEIKKRDEMSERRRQDIRKQANTSIDDFYIDHKERVERNIKENKLTEEEFKTGLTDSLSSGTTWTRICDIIELENSQSKTIARTGAGTTDLGRYKEVLLRLKREGETAPGAAGY
ncbi:hypothetical protein M408DRAFT_28249 [Serendipita vermifera MAFF 305830]|uniref:Clathrin light chain n=1 Tax=Serendipita vermifera MAFF 305830 TaxID=933852 RepID=A0A0C3AUS5_SERVB|nr:hypothetical protein M408DRAFT_28249 [Serendipita vermifera MAFF 305830]